MSADHVSPQASDNARAWDHNAGTYHPRCGECGCLLSPRGTCAVCDPKEARR